MEYGKSEFESRFISLLVEIFFTKIIFSDPPLAPLEEEVDFGIFTKNVPTWYPPPATPSPDQSKIAGQRPRYRGATHPAQARYILSCIYWVGEAASALWSAASRAIPHRGPFLVPIWHSGPAQPGRDQPTAPTSRTGDSRGAPKMTRLGPRYGGPTHPAPTLYILSCIYWVGEAVGALWSVALRAIPHRDPFLVPIWPSGQPSQALASPQQPPAAQQAAEKCPK